MNQDLLAILNADLHRYGYKNEKLMSFMERRELYGYRYTKAMRKCRYYKEQGAKLRFCIWRLHLSHLSVKYGFQISYATDVGAGLYLGHMGSIIINCKAKLGNNVNLAQGVTIGIANGGRSPGVPVIGHDVWIGANATVVGGVSIGNDVIIAPNTFVNFDVPDHSVVISSKAKIIPRDCATENYINNRVEE